MAENNISLSPFPNLVSHLSFCLLCFALRVLLLFYVQLCYSFASRRRHVEAERRVNGQRGQCATYADAYQEQYKSQGLLVSSYTQYGTSLRAALSITLLELTLC